jgi:hypothetical protein
LIPAGIFAILLLMTISVRIKKQADRGENAMKAMICEMCNGTNILKQDGVFVCQNCGCKYTLDEARKLIIDGPVEVHGKVSVDGIGSVDNYLKLAKRYEDNEEYDRAVQYYEKAFEVDSLNEEAVSGLERMEQKIPVNITKKRQLSTFIKFIVYIDGEKIAKLSNDETISIPLKPGIHKLVVECSPRPMAGGRGVEGDFNVTPGDDSVDFLCHVNMRNNITVERV